MYILYNTKVAIFLAKENYTVNINAVFVRILEASVHLRLDLIVGPVFGRLIRYKITCVLVWLTVWLQLHVS